MTKTTLRALACSASAVALLGATPAFAADLFSERGSARSNAKAHVASSETVRVNRGALNSATLDFVLDGERVTAVRTRIDKRERGQVVWIGHIQDNPGHTVIITARGAAISGVIHTGTQSWEIRREGGEEVLNRMQLDNLPLEDVGGVPDGGGDPSAVPNMLADIVDQDLVVVYTPLACERVGGTGDTACTQIEADITTAVADINAAYQSSGIDIRMNLVALERIDFDDAGTSSSTVLSQLTNTSDGIMDEVHPLRDSVGADLVALISASSGCGVAYAPASPTSAFSVTNYSCLVGNRTMAHEIGHNQGALHDRDQHGQGTVGAYNYGFKRCADGSDEDFGAPYFRTVMSYSCAGAPRVGRFSNPNVTYSGVPQGIDPDVNPERGAYNVRTINESAAYVAGFRGAPVVVTPPVAPSGLTASANGFDSIILGWSDNSDNESGFDVERDGVVVASLGSNTTSFTDVGLSAVTTYTYRVVAANSAGSAASNTTSATTEAQPSTITVTASGETPGSGTVAGTFANTTADDGSVQRITEVGNGGPKRRRTQGYQHTWTFNVSGGAGGVSLAANAYVSGAEGANFSYSTNGGASFAPMFTVSSTSSANAEGFVFPAGTSGQVLVSVTDAARTQGEAVDSVSVDYLAITSSNDPGTPPAAPSNLAVGSVASGAVNLTFTDNSSDEFGFELRRSSAAPASCTDGSVVATAGANAGSVSDDTVSPSTTYHYQLSSYNGAGSVGCSNSVSATTPAAPAITASASGYKVKGSQRVDVTWAGVGTTSADIYRDGALIVSTANDGAYTDSINRKGGGSYTYRVCESGSASACSADQQVIF